MSIKVSLSTHGLEEAFTPPTLKEMCLYKCLTNKEILIKEVEVDEDMDGSQSEKLPWEKYRLKEAIQKDLVEALLNAGGEYLLQLTPKYEPVLAAIRMSQPEHLVKVHVNNTKRLTDNQLEWLISGGNVKSLDIHGCIKLGGGSLDAINKFGGKLKYLRIGDSFRVLPDPNDFGENTAILRTPNLKTFIVSGTIQFYTTNVTNYWRWLLQDFISNLEDLQISSFYVFESLDFLEKAKTKLSFLSLRNCGVFPKNANAWASLFKLDKLKSLDLFGSWIGKAFVGENVVQLLLDAMPNLTRLAVDPGLVKDIHVDTPIRGQGPVAKRLEFLGIMENEVTELRKAKLLANDVAYFGTVEGELRILEEFSNRLNSDDNDHTLDLLESLYIVVPCNSVAVIGLLLKIIIKNGSTVVNPDFFFEILKKLLAATTNVAAKLGNVLVDQCIEAIFAFMSGWSGKREDSLPIIFSDLIDILMILNAELCCDHYTTVLPMVIHATEIEMTMGSILLSNYTDIADKEHFKRSIKKAAQLLEKAVDRFPGETNALWGISSVIALIKQLKDLIHLMVSMERPERNANELVEILSVIIASLRKMCLNSGPRRTAFHSSKGVGIVMDLLKEIMYGWLSVADCDSVALLEIIKSILQDTKLHLSESGMIASDLETLLLSVHSKWELRKSSNSQNSERETSHYFQLESISGLLNFLESDPRYDYKASADVKTIMMKLK